MGGNGFPNMNVLEKEETLVKCLFMSSLPQSVTSVLISLQCSGIKYCTAQKLSNMLAINHIKIQNLLRANSMCLELLL